jgi:hypothetical protein
VAQTAKTIVSKVLFIFIAFSAAKVRNNPQIPNTFVSFVFRNVFFDGWLGGVAEKLYLCSEQ